MIYDASGIKCYGSVNHSAGLIRPKNRGLPTNKEVRNGGTENWILPAIGFLSTVICLYRRPVIRRELKQTECW